MQCLLHCTLPGLGVCKKTIVWRDSSTYCTGLWVYKATKRLLCVGIAVPNALYYAGSWSMGVADNKRLNAMEVRCLRSIMMWSNYDGQSHRKWEEQPLTVPVLNRYCKRLDRTGSTIRTVAFLRGSGGEGYLKSPLGPQSEGDHKMRDLTIAARLSRHKRGPKWDYALQAPKRLGKPLNACWAWSAM